MKKNTIFFLLGLAFVLRIYKINSPIIGMHSWRQADTAAISRNYYENGYKFFYPQIDWGGDSPGYVETEFPIYSFIVALIYKIFGISEVFGRLLSVIFSLITIYFLYLLVLKLVNKNTALWSCFFFAIFPPNIFYSRTFQSESALLMSLVLGVYFFSQWLDTEKKRYFFLSSTFIALTCLLKLPSLYIGLPLLYLAWLKSGKKVLIQWSLGLYSFLVLLPVVIWYYHAHQIFLKYGLTFGIWEYGSDKWGNWNLVFTLKFWNRILFQNLAEDYFTWIGFVIFIIGLSIKRKTKQEKFFDIWIVSLVIYFVIVAQGNYVHLYYQLPFMIPSTVFLGKVFMRYFSPYIFKNKKSLVLLISLIGILALGAGRYYIYIKKENTKRSDVFKLAEIVKKKTEEKSLIIAVDSNDPTLLYLSHKKGWHAFPGQLNDSFLAQKKQKGAKYIIGTHSSFRGESEQKILRSLFRNYQVVFDDEKSFILKILKEK